MERRILVALFLVAATLVVYWRVSNHGFVEFDDPQYVRDNPWVLNGLTGDGIWWALTTNYYANWHPLTWLSLMLDAEVFHSNPAGYHLTNLLFHVLNVLLLFELLRSMTGAVWRSALVAALLALHPLHVESVAWITERKDVLSMLLWILTIAAYIRFTRRGGGIWYLLVIALFALALMAKTMVVTLPFVLLLLDYWPLQRWKADSSFVKRGITLTREKLPLAAMSIGACVLTYISQIGNKALEDGVWMPLSARLANAIVSYVRYLGKLFWPVDLAVLYPNPAQIGRASWSAWQVIGAGAILVAISLVAWALRRKQPYVIVGWLWYLGTMIPVIGLVQIGRHSMADRYAYIPFIGLYIILAWGGAEVASRFRVRWVAAVASAAAIALCAVLTFQQVSIWKDSVTLFQHAIDVTQNNWLMHNNLAGMYSKQGRIDQAIEEINKALVIYPESAPMHSALGEFWFKKFEWYKAQEELEKAIELNGKLAEPHRNLGVIFSRRNQMNRAIAEFETAVRLDPDNSEARKSLAIALANEDEVDRAIEQLEQGIVRQPHMTNEFRQLIATIRSQRRSAPAPMQPGISR